MSINQTNYFNNPLNNSKSKATFTFSKSKRFPSIKNIFTDTMYDLPSTKDKKAIIFDRSSKLQLKDKRISPPPGSYELPSDFSVSKLGFKFGYGRDQLPMGSILQKANINKNNPSPDKYNPQVNTFSKRYGFMGKRLASEQNLRAKSQIPGPGTYQLVGTTMKKSGSYFLSTYINSRALKFYQKHQRKQSDRKQRMKTEQIYINDNNTEQKQFGVSHLSKYKNINAYTFSKTKRVSLSDKSKKHIPGFKYKLFSEFGAIQS